MEDGRLGAVNRGIRRNRKVIYVTNEIIKNKQKLFESSLVRDHDKMVYKLAASEFKARKAALMNRVLLQCLNVNKKVSVPSNASDLGVYGGRPLDSFSKDIEQWIAWQHPRLRRLRKVDQIKRNCLNVSDQC
ncbi:unnamed protein product [Lymnaea stagnalis]|uniref:Uncharacterized protein n=1 Tax=Lymnaea stagnalis TaxID=6523 RepID=A0AAV2HXV1_LYMST